MSVLNTTDRAEQHCKNRSYLYEQNYVVVVGGRWFGFYRSWPVRARHVWSRTISRYADRGEHVHARTEIRGISLRAWESRADDQTTDKEIPDTTNSKIRGVVVVVVLRPDLSSTAAQHESSEGRL